MYGSFDPLNVAWRPAKDRLSSVIRWGLSRPVGMVAAKKLAYLPLFLLRFSRLRGTLHRTTTHRYPMGSRSSLARPLHCHAPSCRCIPSLYPVIRWEPCRPWHDVCYVRATRALANRALARCENHASVAWYVVCNMQRPCQPKIKTCANPPLPLLSTPGSPGQVRSQ